MAMEQVTPSSPPSTLNEHNEAWLRSIDTVYALFEDTKLSAKYPRLAALVKDAVKLVEDVIAELGIEQCALSYNGGKDCNVLIHIVSAVLRRRSTSTSYPALPRLPAVYIVCESPFEDVESFVGASRTRYNLDLVRVHGGMRQGLEEYLDGGARGVKAIFVGTRRTDPHGATLTHRDPTDSGWPDVDRVHPIIDWDYADVWHFLRCAEFGAGGAGLPPAERKRTGTADALGVPYCSLYDEGYTSLGSTFNTFPNPMLRAETPSGDATWRPAYMLEDGATERAGRQSSTSKTLDSPAI